MQFVKWQVLFSTLDSNRFIHSLKTAIAFLLGLVVSILLHLPLQGRWVLITILVVMCAQSRVGAILQKSYMRFVGTAMGAIVATLMLWLIYPNVLLTILVLCLATALFSYIADSHSTWSEAGPLGAVTLIIIINTENPNFYTVVSRFLEINLGIVIALLVSRFIWPLHSRKHLILLLNNTFQNLKKLFDLLWKTKSNEGKEPYELLEDKIVAQLATQKNIFQETMRETFGRCQLSQVFKLILQSQREILRSIVLMRNALLSFSEKTMLLFAEETQGKEVVETILTLFEVANSVLKGKENPRVPTLKNLLKWKENLKLYFKKITLSKSDRFLLDLFLFSFERLITQLNLLISLVKNF